MRQQDLPTLEAYADALLHAADQTNLVDTAFQEAEQLRLALAQHPELLRLMERPAIPKDEKKALIRKVFEGQLIPIMLHLPLILIDNNRGGLWDGILEFFISRVEHRRDIHSAEVSTARALSDAEKKTLKSSLEKRMGQHLRITFVEKPDLMGGVLFRCDDTLIDSSLSRALDKLHARLQGVKVE